MCSAMPLASAPRCRANGRLLRPVLTFYRLDADLGVLLPVALLAPVVLAPLALEDDELPRAALARDRADHACARHERAADAGLALATDHEHLVERDALPDLAGQPLHAHGPTGREAHLLAARAHHRVHHVSSAKRGSIGDSPAASTGWATGSGAAAASSGSAPALSGAAGTGSAAPLPPSQGTRNATFVGSSSEVSSNCSWWRSARARTSTSRPSRTSRPSSIPRAGPSSCSATRRDTVTASFLPPKRGRSFWISRSTL